MTGGQFREVDPDLLADYVGGALDGTPDETEVAGLITDDPAWAQAYATLAPAVDTVRVSLADWGTSAPAMPPDVTDRLTAVLAQASQAGPESTPRAGRQLIVVAGESGGSPRAGTRGRAGARRRWLRPSGPVAAIAGVAAAIAALAGFGLSQLGNHAGREEASGTAFSSSSADSARGVPGEASTAAPHAVLAPSNTALRASGTDYAPDTLAASVLAFGVRPSGARPSGTQKSGEVQQSAPDQISTLNAAGLERLADPAALAACLDAVAATHAKGGLTVDLVDYASFEGKPALVLTFADQSGARWAWVSGPGCGLAGSGADTRHRIRVG